MDKRKPAPERVGVSSRSFRVADSVFTAYIAETRVRSFTTVLYAGIFPLITVVFMLLQKAIAWQFGANAELRRWIGPPLA